MLIRAFITLAFLFAQKVAETSADANKPCSTACGCKKRLHARLGLYTTKLKEAKQTNHQNLKEYNSLLLAAAVGSPLDTTIILPILAGSGELIQQCNEQISAADKAVAAATIKVGEASGVYNVIHKLKDGMGKLMINFGGGDLQLPASKFTTNNLGKLYTDDCAAAADGETDVKTDLEHEPKEPEPTKLITHAYLEAKCDSNPGAPATCHNAAVDQDTQISIGLGFGNGAKDEKSAWGAGSHTKMHKIASTAVDFFSSNETAAHQALKALATDKTGLPACHSLQDFGAMAETRAFQLMLLKLAAGKPEAEKVGPDDRQDIDSAITSSYGKSGANYKDKIWDQIQKTEVPQGKQTGEKTAALEKGADIKLQTEAFARLFAKEIKEKKQAKTTQKVSKTTDRNKQTEKTAEECKNLGCDHDAENKKCKPKAETESTAPGAGATAGCTKHGTDKPKCEGDKSCKGNGKECKDSSFIVNKKLASMNAAFVSFIAF
ncbi:variant surface glycoprotein [Trypanosoma brucei equiperdum]|uniref:Variant surface glycoprotein n=2 Tax=Trypanosoma brucei TaxID=5691 RepID=A0A3L6L4V1_9TRYP|nr:variant surface glycoprotein 1125.315 [Trypanosoma brucei]RHW71684.1 variant surface glycoprotein [Trypanosoma brucei equiperdum]